MEISSYQNLGPAISWIPEIRHRNMPVTQPSAIPILAGSNARGFHVNDAGAFHDYAYLRYSAGQWQEALEYIVWIRDWATDPKSKQPVGEYATIWYGATSSLISHLQFMGFQEEALSLIGEGLAAPHGQTYHGRWKVFLTADHLDALSQLKRAPADIIAQYESLIEKAKSNGHINISGVWSFRIKLADALIQSGRTREGEEIYDQLASEGSLDARKARLKHWIRSGRTDSGVEEELKDLLRLSRETGQKMSEYSLYRDYADFLEASGRLCEALLMRRAVVRLAKSFRLFTHLPLEQSKLAVLLLRLGDKSGSAGLADAARAQLNRGRLPASIIAEIKATLAKLEGMAGPPAADDQTDK